MSSNTPYYQGTRQYVGPRFVPKFADPIEWQTNTTYEPLTIVTYFGNSYTSIHAVPANIMPTNSAYWAPTGNYNAQVEEYRQIVLGVQNDVQNLQTRMSANEETTANLIKWQTNTYIFIGDSYAIGFNPDGNGSTTDNSGSNVKAWPSYIQDYMGLTEGENAFTEGNGGSGFARGAVNNGKRFVDLLNQAIARLTTYQKNSNVTVVALGGYNDRIYTAENLMPYIKTFVDTAKASMPRCKVYIGCVGKNFGPLAADNESALGVFNGALPGYCKCGQAGAGYIPNSENCLCRLSQFFNDYVHPNTNGQIAIAQLVSSFLLGGDIDVIDNELTTLSATGNTLGLSFSNVNVYTAVVNGKLTVNTNNITISATCDPQNIKFQGALRIGTVSGDLIPLLTTQVLCVNCTLNLVLSDNSVVNMPASELAFYGNQLLLTSNSLNDNGTYKTIQNVKSLFIKTNGGPLSVIQQIA